MVLVVSLLVNILFVIVFGCNGNIVCKSMTENGHCKADSEKLNNLFFYKWKIEIYIIKYVY